MKKFEYKSIAYETTGLFGGKVNLNDFDAVLNSMGSDGWELTNSIPSNQESGKTRNIICIFRREI